MRIFLIFFSCIFVLSACGQSGHLFLPNDDANKQPTPIKTPQHGMINKDNSA